METMQPEYDVAIIGGGAAGLSAAQALGRSRRKVIVIDEGKPRNAPAEGVHNFLTRDGTAPHELLRLGRAELGSYGVDFRDARAVGTSGAADGFTIMLADGAAGAGVTARRIILAGGVKDTLPRIAGLRDYWGKNVLHCPYCHGWEVRDKVIGVLDSPFAVHQAMMFSQLSKNVTLFTSPETELDPLEHEKLQARGIRVTPREVIGVRGSASALTHLRFADGGEQEIEAVVVMPRFAVDLTPVAGLGLVAAAHPSGIGTHLATGETGETDVPGVWAAGNLRDPMAQVIMAAAEGLRVGAMVNADLIQEETDAAVLLHRQDAVAGPEISAV